MKSILTGLLFFLSFIVSAQQNNEIKDFFWGAKSPSKNTTEIPEKYKNESAVVIFKGEYYDYHKFGAKVKYTSSFRKRIKLLDQAAVKEFSEFSFKKNFQSQKGLSYYTAKNSTVIFGLKIIKSNGEEIEIDVEKEAVNEDDTKKVAIANLEVGDIVDYYFHIIEPFVSVYEFGFDPVERTLGETYPVLNLQIQFETENDFFVNFASYNGAPELKHIGEKSNDRKYELSATDIPKNDFPRWFYPLAELPCFKFQVFFARSGKFEKRADAFLPEKERIIKTEVSKDDVFEYYDSKFSPNGDLKDIDNFLKGKSFESVEEKVKAVYYFTRHQFFTRYIEAFVMDESKIIAYPYQYYKNPIFFRSEEQFIRYFMQYLKKNKIGYEIIVATDRVNGSIDDLLIQENVRVLLKVNTKTPIYLQYFNPFTTPDQFIASIEGTKAYALKVEKNKKVTDIEEITLPTSTPEDNYSITTLNISLPEGFNQFDVKKEVSLFGHNKKFEQDSKINFYDYVDEDYSKYGTTPLLSLVKKKKLKEQYKKEYDALIKKLKDKQTEEFKKEIEKEYSTEVENVNVTINNTGRFGKNDPLSFTQEFSIKNNLIKKAGSNYILELGKLIDSQVEISEKEKNRNNNIYMNFARSFEYNIILDIPAGYTASGLDKFNNSIVNETGSFTSTAVLDNGKLIIKANKKYNHNFEPKENWDKMVSFLEAAYQFTQEKILLKKL